MDPKNFVGRAPEQTAEFLRCDSANFDANKDILGVQQRLMYKK